MQPLQERIVPAVKRRRRWAVTFSLIIPTLFYGIYFGLHFFEALAEAAGVTALGFLSSTAISLVTFGIATAAFMVLAWAFYNIDKISNFFSLHKALAITTAVFLGLGTLACIVVTAFQIATLITGAAVIGAAMPYVLLAGVALVALALFCYFGAQLGLAITSWVSKDQVQRIVPPLEPASPTVCSASSPTHSLGEVARLSSCSTSPIEQDTSPGSVRQVDSHVSDKSSHDNSGSLSSDVTLAAHRKSAVKRISDGEKLFGNERSEVDLHKDGTKIAGAYVVDRVEENYFDKPNISE